MGLFAIDELHCVGEWRHFREDYTHLHTLRSLLLSRTNHIWRPGGELQGQLQSIKRRAALQEAGKTEVRSPVPRERAMQTDRQERRGAQGEP